jgi:hypothetical protein
MGIIGADLVERLMEHPSTGRMAAIGLAYPALMGAYSNAGRAALNNLFLSQARRIPFSVTPLASQYGASNPAALPALPGQ